MTYDHITTTTIAFNPFVPKDIRFKNLTGQRFTRLVVYSIWGKQSNNIAWLCRCDCGKWAVVTSGHLRRNSQKSCGCYSQARKTTHGENLRGPRSIEYTTYARAKGRCDNPNATRYYDYGGRGVEFRFDSFESFLAEVGRKPSPKHSLDRIDNEGHYEKGNVKWSTNEEQNNNKRTNTFLTHNGITLTLVQWSRKMNLTPITVFHRINTLGWCVPCSLTLPPHQGKCVHREVTINKLGGTT